MADLGKLRIDRSEDGSVRTHRRKRHLWWWAIAVLAAVVAAGVVRWNAPVAVEVTTVGLAYPSQNFTLLNATGYAVAQRKAAVSSKATGRLEWLGVREGSVVKQNEVLARLENKDVVAAMEQAAASIQVAEANLAQGRAELQEAERALERSRDLLAKKFVSQAAHDAVVARHDKASAAIRGYEASIAVARASYRAQQVAVEQTLIRAPFDGVVLTKNANVGDVITPFSSAAGSQAAVVTMADLSTIEVEADVSESSVGKVKVGQPCEIQLDALPGERFRGAVASMVPTVDRSKATVTVKVKFIDNDPRILPEMSAKVAFLDRETPADQRAARTVVLPAAVVERGGRKVVYRVEDGKAVETPLATGMKIGELVEVVSGLKPGDKVIAQPSDKVRNGARVAVAAK